jgi:hypothetical protein
MSDEHILALRQADQARTDFAIIEEPSRFPGRPARACPKAQRPCESRGRDRFLHVGVHDAFCLDRLALTRVFNVVARKFVNAVLSVRQRPTRRSSRAPGAIHNYDALGMIGTIEKIDDCRGRGRTRHKPALGERASIP